MDAPEAVSSGRTDGELRWADVTLRLGLTGTAASLFAKPVWTP
jgi:hypothetical protein